MICCDGQLIRSCVCVCSSLVPGDRSRFDSCRFANITSCWTKRAPARRCPTILQTFLPLCNTPVTSTVVVVAMTNVHERVRPYPRVRQCTASRAATSNPNVRITIHGTAIYSQKFSLFRSVAVFQIPL